MIDEKELKYFSEKMRKIDGFSYAEVMHLHNYSNDMAERVLEELIGAACLAQNTTIINIGRKMINEIDKQWLKEHFIASSEKVVDYDDEWDYRRLVELTVLVIPSLKQEILNKGYNSENEEIREVIEDYI